MSTVFYLCEAGGFFMQFFPCALLCFLPFDQDTLRVRPSRLYPALALISLAVSALFPQFLYGIFWGTYFRASMAANVYMLTVILIAVFAYILLVRDTMVKKLLVVYVVLVYASAVYCALNWLTPDMNPPWHNGIYTYTPYHLLFYTVVQLPLLPLMWLFMRRKVLVFLREIGNERARAEFRFASVSTAAFLTLMMVGDSMRVINVFIVFLVLNQALIYYMLFSDTIMRTREENALRALEVQNLQYENITSDMARAARMRHDVRHHYTYLYTLAKNGTREELTDYLSSLVSQTEYVENEVFCADPNVNALLQYYVGKARDTDISCEVTAECSDLRIKPEDLTVLIGNILENAIRACGKEHGGGNIDAAIGLVHGAFTLVVTNSCHEVRLAPEFAAKTGYLPASAFLSSRDGGGRGLESVEAVTKKYLGSAAFKYDAAAHTFTSRVILNQY